MSFPRSILSQFFSTGRGFTITLPVEDSNGDLLDLTGLDFSAIARKPDDTTVAITGLLADQTTNTGEVLFTVAASDVDVAGVWEIMVFVSNDGGVTLEPVTYLSFRVFQLLS